MRKSSLKYKVMMHTRDSTMNPSKTPGPREKGVLTFLPPEALALVASFDMHNFRIMMSVCADWHINLRNGMDLLFKHVETQFINTYGEFLLFKESHITSQPIVFCEKTGLRVD